MKLAEGETGDNLQLEEDEIAEAKWWSVDAVLAANMGKLGKYSVGWVVSLFTSTLRAQPGGSSAGVPGAIRYSPRGKYYLSK